MSGSSPRGSREIGGLVYCLVLREDGEPELSKDYLTLSSPKQELCLQSWHEARAYHNVGWTSPGLSLVPCVGDLVCGVYELDLKHI